MNYANYIGQAAGVVVITALTTLLVVKLWNRYTFVNFGHVRFTDPSSGNTVTGSCVHWKNTFGVMFQSTHYLDPTGAEREAHDHMYIPDKPVKDGLMSHTKTRKVPNFVRFTMPTY